MLYTPHFLVGAAILKLVPNPLIGVPLAFGSHILLDMIPHNDFGLLPGITLKDIFAKDKKMKTIILTTVGIDIVIMFSFALFLWMTKHNPFILLGGGVGILPDLFDQTLMSIGVPLSSWQNHFQFRVRMRYGFISYPIVVLIALFLLGL